MKILLLLLLLSGCATTPNDRDLLERYCIASEGKITKAIIRFAISTQIKGDLPDICERHYEDRSLDYRPK